MNNTRRKIRKEVSMNPATCSTDLSTIPTADLVRELQTREAVDFHAIAPYEDYSVTVNGPVVLLVVWD